MTMGTSRTAAPQVRIDRGAELLAIKGARDRNKALAAKLEAERKLKEGISGHRTGLPKKLLELFAPLPLPGVLPELKKRPPKVPYTGIGQYVAGFADKGDPEYEPEPDLLPTQPRPPPERIFKNPELVVQARYDHETRAEKKIRLAAQKISKAKEQIEDGLKDWDPKQDEKVEGDPFKTLFVGRISYDATEKKLRREFEEYGPIKSVRLVNEKRSGKPRGYAFVEYEHKNDMKTAYKMADGRKVEGRRVIVDVERGRTVPNWRPRRLGGGKGGESREPRPPKGGKGGPAAAPPGLPGLPPSSAAAPPPRMAALPPPPASAERPREKEAERPREADKSRDKERERPREKERDTRPEKERDRDRDRKREREDGERDRDRKRERREENGIDGSHAKSEDRHRSRREDGERREEGERKRDRDERRRDDDRSKRHREDDRSRKRERDLV